MNYQIDFVSLGAASLLPALFLGAVLYIDHLLTKAEGKKESAHWLVAKIVLVVIIASTPTILCRFSDNTKNRLAAQTQRITEVVVYQDSDKMNITTGKDGIQSTAETEATYILGENGVQNIKITKYSPIKEATELEIVTDKETLTICPEDQARISYTRETWAWNNGVWGISNTTEVWLSYDKATASALRNDYRHADGYMEITNRIIPLKETKK